MDQQTETGADVETTEERDGRTAYTAYRDEVGGVAHDGGPIPAWEDLPDRARRGWLAAGGAVRAVTLTPKVFGEDPHSVTVDQLGAFVSALGIRWDAEDLLSIVAVPGKVTVVRGRTNEDGRPYLLPTPGDRVQQATETVTIAIVAG